MLPKENLTCPTRFEFEGAAHVFPLAEVEKLCESVDGLLAFSPHCRHLSANGLSLADS